VLLALARSLWNVIILVLGEAVQPVQVVQRADPKAACAEPMNYYVQTPSPVASYLGDQVLTLEQHRVGQIPGTRHLGPLISRNKRH
jgi:hypothetical protein